jgi:hypothetical protein
MATVNEESCVELVKNNGVFDGDPQVWAIGRYRNTFNGGLSYFIAYDANDMRRYMSSPGCVLVEVLWTREGLSAAGKEWMEKSNVAQDAS